MFDADETGCARLFRTERCTNHKVTLEVSKDRVRLPSVWLEVTSIDMSDTTATQEMDSPPQSRESTDQGSFEQVFTTTVRRNTQRVY